MTYDFIFVHHCNCITVLLISAFACAAIRLSFGSGSDMLMHFVSSNKRIKFIRAEACVNWNFFFDIFQLKIANFVVLCHFCFRYFFLGFASFIGSLIQKPDYYLLRRCDEICEKLRSSLVGYNRALFFVFSSKIMQTSMISSILKTQPYLFRISDVRVISLTVRSRNHLESNVSKFETDKFLSPMGWLCRYFLSLFLL